LNKHQSSRDMCFCDWCQFSCPNVI